MSLSDGSSPATIACRRTDTQATVQRLDGLVHVLFPGTASRRDMLTDARIIKRPWQHGRVHAGFRAAMLSVWDQLREQIQPGDRVVVAGHSLGGALAMLCADLLVARASRPFVSVEVVAVYTFGQPRVGNWTFSGAYNSRLHNRTFRVVNARDPVPKLPCVFGTYKHAGTEVYLERNGGVKFGLPMVTAVIEAAASLQQISQIGPQKSEFVSLYAHPIKSYVRKLERAFGERASGVAPEGQISPAGQRHGSTLQRAAGVAPEDHSLSSLP